MKKIIASSDQKDPILRKLSSQNHGIVTDTQIIPLSTFLKEEKDDDLVLSIQLSNKLLQAQEHFPIYQAMFLFPVFILEILSFAKECILYSISVDDFRFRRKRQCKKWNSCFFRFYFITLSIY